MHTIKEDESEEVFGSNSNNQIEPNNLLNTNSEEEKEVDRYMTEQKN